MDASSKLSRFDKLVNSNERNVKGDYEDNKLQEMTASYSEIPFECQLSPELSSSQKVVESRDLKTESYLSDVYGENHSNNARPSHLTLKTDCESQAAKNDDSACCQKAMDYLQSEGTVTNDGNLVCFVVEDLENKIKLSSPIPKKNDSSQLLEAKFSSTCLYKHALTPQLPTIDHNILNELENEARKIATSVDSITENLAAILHSASALTVCCLETYRDAVCKTCDTIDYNIKSMYQLMAKCEELSKSMDTFYKMTERIKDIKKMLEIFENSMN